MLPVWLTDTVTSDLDRALHYTLLWGLEGVELRTVGGPADRVPNVNEAKLRHQLEETEMLPAAAVPIMFEQPVSRRMAWLNELATFEETLGFCTRISCPRIVVGCFAEEEEGEAPLEPAAEALRKAGEAAWEHGRVLAVHNAYGMARSTGHALAELLEAVDHDAVRAAWDPAAALRAGEDPAAGLEALGERVELVRCSDGHGRGEAWQEQPFGEGGVDWAGQLERLRQQDFRGPLSLEVRVEPRPEQGLRAATRLIRMIRDVR